MDTPSRYELTQAELDNMNNNRGVDEEAMRDLGYDTLESLPSTIERVEALGEQAVESIFHVNQIGHSAEPEGASKSSASRLELASPERTPRFNAKRETVLRTPRTARTWKERQAADQPPESQRVTPLGHPLHSRRHSGRQERPLRRANARGRQD